MWNAFVYCHELLEQDFSRWQASLAFQFVYEQVLNHSAPLSHYDTSESPLISLFEAYPYLFTQPPSRVLQIHQKFSCETHASSLMSFFPICTTYAENDWKSLLPSDKKCIHYIIDTRGDEFSFGNMESLFGFLVRKNPH